MEEIKSTTRPSEDFVEGDCCRICRWVGGRCFLFSNSLVWTGSFSGRLSEHVMLSRNSPGHFVRKSMQETAKAARTIAYVPLGVVRLGENQCRFFSLSKAHIPYSILYILYFICLHSLVPHD